MKNTWLLIFTMAILIGVVGLVTALNNKVPNGAPRDSEVIIVPNTNGTIIGGPNGGMNGGGATGTPAQPEIWACQMDALICPDGSAVGRTGPKCEFAPCPAANATSTKLTTYLGGTVTGMNLTVNPREVVSDNRCPKNAQCIIAGTIKVRTAISTQVAHGEHVLELNIPRVFGNYTVTLIDATPAPMVGGRIPESTYRFTFEVKKN